MLSQLSDSHPNLYKGIINLTVMELLLGLAIIVVPAPDFSGESVVSVFGEMLIGGLLIISACLILAALFAYPNKKHPNALIWALGTSFIFWILLALACVLVVALGNLEAISGFIMAAAFARSRYLQVAEPPANPIAATMKRNDNE